MSQTTPHTPGAESNLSPVESAQLFKFVADLLKTSPDEREALEQMNLDECQSKIDDLIRHVHDPYRKVFTIKRVIGRLFLFHHQSSRLEIEILRKENQELSSSCDRLDTRNQKLHEELKLSNETLVTCISMLDTERSNSVAVYDQAPKESRETSARALAMLRASSRESEAEVEPVARRGVESDADTSDCLLTSRLPDKPERHAVAPSHNPGGARSCPPAPERLLKPQAAKKERKSKSHAVAKPTHCEPSSSSFSSDSYDESSSPLRNSSSSSSESERPRRSRKARRGSSPALRMRQLDSLAEDIERFDPSSHNSTIEDYLREIEHSLSDLPHVTSREKLKLIWKTTSGSVHAFIETQTPRIRDKYSRLCKVLREEYSPYTDETLATISAIQIRQRRTEPPREYYARLRHAFFQGSSAPGLEEHRAFRSLFIHNLHPCVRTHVALTCQQGKPTMRKIRKNAQRTWETVVRPVDQPDEEPRVLNVQSTAGDPLDSEGCEVPLEWPTQRGATQNRFPQNHHQGGWKSWQGNGNQMFNGQPRNDMNKPNGQYPRREQPYQGKGNRQQGRYPRKFNRDRFPQEPNDWSNHGPQRGHRDRQTESGQSESESQIWSEIDSLKDLLIEIKKQLPAYPTNLRGGSPTHLTKQ